MKQLSLFDLSPLNKDKPRIKSDKGGLSEITIRNFKGIKDLSVSLSPMTLLIGANNSGKSTILQAVRLFYYCIDKCGVSINKSKVIFKKQVMPFTDFSLIPAHDVKELVVNGISPSSKKYGIYLCGTLASGQTFDFTIYSAYSTLFVILPGDLCPKSMSDKSFDYASRQPLYVPGFAGVVTRENLYTNRRLEESLGSGHHNEVLRNLILRLKTPDIKYLASLLSDEFGVRFQGVSDDPNDVEFLKASYRERLSRINFDVVSAGSGFLQVLQILTHSLQSPSPIVLLDEPDAHMHTRLQERFITLLRNFAKSRHVQIIMASHSETFTRTIELSEIRLIDRNNNRCESFVDPDSLKQELHNQGVWPDEPKLTEALRIKKLLLCESLPDHDLVCSFGEIKNKNWPSLKNSYQVIETEGSNDNIVERVKVITDIFNKMLNGSTNVAYFRDRDLMCDERKTEAEQETEAQGLSLFITERRNRESYLVEPSVVESAAFQFREKLPEDWKVEGKISSLVKQWAIQFCKNQRTELPTRVREYNLSWVRRKFAPGPEQHDADGRIEAFIQDHWYKELDNERIPWKLMNGKEFLKLLRQKFQEYGIMISDRVLLAQLTQNKVIPEEFIRLIETIEKW